MSISIDVWSGRGGNIILVWWVASNVPDILYLYGFHQAWLRPKGKVGIILPFVAVCQLIRLHRRME